MTVALITIPSLRPIYDPDGCQTARSSTILGNGDKVEDTREISSLAAVGKGSMALYATGRDFPGDPKNPGQRRLRGRRGTSV